MLHGYQTCLKPYGNSLKLSFGEWELGRQPAMSSGQVCTELPMTRIMVYLLGSQEKGRDQKGMS